jgi:uncharacterized protein
MKVAVTGATGFIGRAVVRALLDRGDEVVAFSRSQARARAALGAQVRVVETTFDSDPSWREALAKIDAVVHLAGESIGDQRWNAQVKQRLRDSRVETTSALVAALAALPPAQRPKVLVSSSGVDYYPEAVATAEFDADPVSEADPAGSSFLARICRDWEQEAMAAQAHAMRVVCLRTGLVLAARGGALARMLTSFRWFVGGPIGHGRQWVSWIHLDDVVAAVLFAIGDDRLRGPVNLVAPGAVRNRDLAKAIGRRLGRPSALPVPAFAVRAAVGELSEYLLNGRRAVPAALEAVGFVFARPTLAEALADLDLG